MSGNLCRRVFHICDDICVWGGPEVGPIQGCTIMQIRPEIILVRLPALKSKYMDVPIEHCFKTIESLEESFPVARALRQQICVVNHMDLGGNYLLRKRMENAINVYEEKDLIHLMEPEHEGANVIYHVLKKSDDFSDNYYYSWSVSDFFALVLGDSFSRGNRYRNFPKGQRTIVIYNDPKGFCQDMADDYFTFIDMEPPGNLMLKYFTRREVFKDMGHSVANYILDMKYRVPASAKEVEEKETLFG